MIRAFGGQPINGPIRASHLTYTTRCWRWRNSIPSPSAQCELHSHNRSVKAHVRERRTASNESSEPVCLIKRACFDRVLSSSLRAEPSSIFVVSCGTGCPPSETSWSVIIEYAACRAMLDGQMPLHQCSSPIGPTSRITASGTGSGRPLERSAAPGGPFRPMGAGRGSAVQTHQGDLILPLEYEPDIPLGELRLVLPRWARHGPQTAVARKPSGSDSLCGATTSETKANVDI